MKPIILILMFTFVSISLFAQDDEKIDASKPTNFYSLIDNTFEYMSTNNGNTMGYRGNITFAPNASHLLLGEVPLLYNDRTEKFGIGDLRARYFFLPYKNYDKFIGAAGPSLDVFAPTGSFENGLGSGRWILSPGVTVGLMAADWIQFFPILSYQYISKSNSDLIPDALDKVKHGVTFQVLTPIVFSEKFFMQVTSIYQMNNLGDEKEDRYVQELNAVYSIAEKMQLSGYFRGNFTDEIYTYRLGLAIFL